MIALKSPLVLVLALLIGLSTARTLTYDIYGKLIMDKDGRYPSSTCCIVPTCNRPEQCFQMTRCDYLCKTGKYPPVEVEYTPGYQLKTSYLQFQCMFGECKNYEMSCRHCQAPNESDFNIVMVREDCKECYQQVQ